MKLMDLFVSRCSATLDALVLVLPRAELSALGEPRMDIRVVQNGTAYGHRPNAPCDANVRRRRAYGACEF